MALVPCPECKAQVSRAATSCPQCGFPFGGATAIGVPLTGGGAVPLAPSKEEVLWEGTPSLKALAVQVAATVVFAIVVPLVVYFAYGPVRDALTQASRDAATLVVEHEDTARTVIILGVIALVGSRAVRLGWRMLALRGHRYRVSNQRVTIESGVLSKSLVEIDVRTIDDITFTQSLVERLMGIGQIAIQSSDPTTPRARLLGVPDPRQVRELVRSAAYQATRGQLFTRST
ncbi:MAG TPA: PH domain-containing protein [Polyangia bacterium]|nr:PH domain-containing protein [Polyangia bacterium]